MESITLRVIQGEADYEALLKRIDELFNASPGSLEGYELEVLLLMADQYQKKTHPLRVVEPVEVLQFIMEQRGLSQQDIAPYLGGNLIACQVMSGQRGLTPQMIKNLSAHLHIPVGALI